MSRRILKSLDKFPNFMSGTLSNSSANAFTTTKVNTPLPRIKTSGKKATVLELLRLEVEVTNTDLIANSDEVEFEIILGTTPTSMVELNDPRVVAKLSIVADIGANPGNTIVQYPLIHNFEIDGYGYLLASDYFHVSIDTNGMAAACNYYWRLFYRFVDIPLEEYIGIVQSTQQT